MESTFKKMWVCKKCRKKHRAQAGYMMEAPEKCEQCGHTEFK